MTIIILAKHVCKRIATFSAIQSFNKTLRNFDNKNKHKGTFRI